MGDRPNKYQRRVADRQLNRVVLGTLVMTLLFFAFGAFLVHSSYMNAVYQQVLASGGRLTVDDVQAGYLANLVIPFVVVWIVLAVIVSLSELRTHNSFEFGEDAPLAAAGRQVKPVQLHKLSPRQFEEVVARMIAQQGYKTKVVGGAGDQGVDVKVFNPQGQLVGVVQCKRYRPNKALAPSFVREMATVRQMHGVNIAYLATTAYFTEETKALARQLNVRLIDGHDLKQISRKTALPQNSDALFQRPKALGQPDDFNRDMNGMWDEPARAEPPPRKPWASFPPNPYAPPPAPDVQQQLDERRRRLNLPKRPRGKWDMGR